MDMKELDRLLERFYSGESSPEEEGRLIDFLSVDDIPESYWPDRDILLTVKDKEEIPEPSDELDNLIRKRLDLEERKVVWRSRSRKLYLAVTVAASILIAISSYLIVRSGSNSNLTLAEKEMVSLKAFTTIKSVSATLQEGKSALSDIAYISVAEKHLSAIPQAGSAARKDLSALDFINFSLNDLIGSGESRRDDIDETNFKVSF